MGAGRQREFDKQVALDAAVNVFWTNGYNGTSLSDLTDAMGINKPSLYAAFGNKEALFISALERYVGTYGSPHMEKLNAPNMSLRSRLITYLESIAWMVSDPALPGGCFVAATTNEAGGDCLPTGVRDAIAGVNRLTREAFIEFFRHEAAAGEIASEDSAVVFADYLLMLQYGLAVMARNGVTRRALNDVIERAASAFQ